MVHVFRVESSCAGAREVEQGHPITWFTREEFLRWSPFAEFYVRMFEVLDQSEGVEVDVYVLDWDLDAPAADNKVKDLEQQ
jgi:hypothetical protein